MILSFVWPSTYHRTGGVVALFEFANAMVRRGHNVHFIHGPFRPGRIATLAEIDWFPFEANIEHHIVDTLDDPGLPAADVVFWHDGPERLGHRAVFIQGYHMLPLEIEVAAFHTRGPKVCVATWLVDVGRELGVPPEQLWHVPLGLDHRQFSSRTPSADRPHDVAVLYNVHPTKGWHVAIAALRHLRERIPDVRVTVFSAIEPKHALDEWLDVKVGLDHAGLAAEVYDAARVYMVASNYEGFGFTAIEAMACGAALVTTDNGGSRDYALHDETAVVVPPGDATALAAAVADLLRDPLRRDRLARAGERFVRRFDWDTAGATLEQHLDRYLADPAALCRRVADPSTRTA